jgi:methyl-accepting chemotaxis protein
MKSLKGKLVLAIISLIAVSVLVSVTLIALQSFNVTDSLINTVVVERLQSNNNMLETYLKEEFGPLSLNNGKLVDSRNKAIDGKYQYIDRFSQDLGVVATVFAKDGNDFTRVITTVVKENGERAVGTILDTSGQAYQEVSKGNEYYGEADILGSRYMTAYKPFFDKNQQVIGVYFVGLRIEDINEIFNHGKQEILRSIIILAIIILVIATLATYVVSSRIVRPITKITEAAHKIAKGDFNVELSVNSKDEVGQLASAFSLTINQLVNNQEYIDEISDTLHQVSQGNLRAELHKEYDGQFKKLKDSMQQLLANLNSTMLQISQSSDQLHSSSEQVANASQALSQGATEQASSIEELSASIAEVTEQIKRNAENSKSAREKAAFAGKEIDSSNEHMNEMIEAMEQIAAKSSEISKIIKIIDDIAFQTNILALNAAVEAARAGAAGKGFAVVADEVGSLAGKSAQAVKNTTVLIEESIKAVTNGTEIADKTAAALTKSVQVTMEAVSLIDEIALASQEQATAIVQINQGLEQISDVVQTNAATAQESAAASEELSGQADILNELIAKFDLKETDLKETSEAALPPQQDYVESAFSLPDNSILAASDFDSKY